MAIESDEYRLKLNESIKYRDHLKKTCAEHDDLLNHISASVDSGELNDKLQTLKDQQKNYTFIYKTHLDDFMALCEGLIHGKASTETQRQIYMDLVEAGFDSAKDGVNHPLLKQLEYDFK